ncbi:MAG: glycosyltransferase family 2 protein [Candidatus Omnitrophota bacterium]
MSDQVTLSVILPVYNEESNIRKTVEEVYNHLHSHKNITGYEIILVDDGSTDRSPDILKDLGKSYNHVTVVTLPVNKGYGKALISGIERSRHEWILLMDSDGQIKINSIDPMLNYTRDYDIIAGYRSKRVDPVHRIMLGKLYTFCVGAAFGIKSKDINCGFKLFHKQFLETEGIDSHAGAFYTHVFINARVKKARIKEVPIEHFVREGGVPTGANIKVVGTAMADFIQLIFRKK